jgi:hypothetical protein
MFHEIKEDNLFGDHASRLGRCKMLTKFYLEYNENKLSESPKRTL